MWIAVILIGILAPLIAYANNRQNQTVAYAAPDHRSRVLRVNEDLPYTVQKVSTVSKRKVAVKPRENKASEKKSIAADSGRDYGQGEIQNLIIKYSHEYGIRSEVPLCIAKKESGFNPLSANKHSTARGVFQYLSGTWASTDEGKAGLSVFDADANVRAAVKYIMNPKIQTGS